MDKHKLEIKAIEAALHNKWTEAIEYNKKILEIEPENIEALLRLGFSYLQTKQYKEAEKVYKKVLELRPNNPLAKEKLKQVRILLKEKDQKQTVDLKLDPNLFTDVPGKTRTVELVNLGQKNILAKLNIGEPVKLKIRKRRVEVRTYNDEYIGSLPDDLSKRLILFLNAGTEYKAYIKEANLKEVIIFLKEHKKPKKLERFISFPEDLHKNLEYLEKLVSSDEDIEETEEETETEEDIEEIPEEEVASLEEIAENLEEEDSPLSSITAARYSDDEEEEE